MSVTIPAQGRQRRWSSSRPGSNRTTPQCAQTPTVLVASRKQMPQMHLSGQRTRILLVLRWQRSQVRSPVVRGRPRRGGAAGVSVITHNPRAYRLDRVGHLHHVAAGSFPWSLRVRGGDRDQILRAAAEDVAERGNQVQGNAFRSLDDDAVDLRGGQVDAPLAQQRRDPIDPGTPDRTPSWRARAQ